MDFIAGCVGGAAGVLAGHPLDTVKVRMQTQKPGQYRGITHCVAQMLKNEGPSSFMKGLSSPLASLTVLNSIVFGVYGNTLKLFSDKQSYLPYFLAGSLSGIVQTVIATPTEMIKLRVQLAGNERMYRSPYHCLKVLLREKGPAYLFKGSLATQLRDAPGFGVYFVSYEFVARNLSEDGSQESLTTWQLLLAGGSAGMVSWAINYPVDLVKTLFQADDKYSHYSDAIRDTYRTSGFRGFFNGIGTCLLRAFPSNAATFFAVEWTYRLLLELQHWSAKRKTQPHRECILCSCPTSLRYSTMHHFWGTNALPLPEAGSTYIDPMIHYYRFI